MCFVLSPTTVYIQEERIQKEEPRKLDLELEIERFNSEIKNLDKAFSKNKLDMDYYKRLLQGPLSDILTHVGQISMLSRSNNNPIEWEDFSSSTIRI